jgi:voltage-gated sodium channel
MLRKNLKSKGKHMTTLSRWCQKIEASQLFFVLINLAIITSAVNVGIQTYKGFYHEHQMSIDFVNHVVLYTFVLEFFIKIIARAREPLSYFRDPWNSFDFSIVVLCLMETSSFGQFVVVLRLVRLLKVLRLLTSLPKLNMIVGALINSIPSVCYIFSLLLLHFYIYAVMGTFLFSENDPFHFGNLQTSVLSLFRAVTLEDWSDMMYINMYGSDLFGYNQVLNNPDITNGLSRTSHAYPILSPIYFVTFVMSGSIIVLNLVIGVIMNGMDEMKRESEISSLVKAKAKGGTSLAEEIDLIEKDVLKLSRDLITLSVHIKQVQTVREKAQPQVMKAAAKKSTHIRDVANAKEGFSTASSKDPSNQS